MTKILLLSKYSRLGASSRLRTQQYIPYLAESNIDVTVAPLFNDAYLDTIYRNKKLSKFSLIKMLLSRIAILFKAKKYDFLWIEKELLPYFPAFFELLLKMLGIKYVVDYDDAIFHNYDLSSNKLIKSCLSNKIDKVMKYSDVVIVGNQYLGDRAKKAGAKNVRIIPTVIDISRYPAENLTEKNKFTIGWIGSPSTQKYIVDLYETLVKLNNEIEFTLLLVGATKDIIEKLPGLDVQLFDWQESLEVIYINKMDIGIMPLVDGPWELGKCGYKLIQYMACSKAVVASPVGVNIDIVTNNQCGLLAKDEQEWFDHLLELAKNQPLRVKSAENGRKAVETTYCVQQQLPNLLASFTLALT